MRLFVLRCSLVLVPLSMLVMVALIAALSHKALAGWLWMEEHEMHKHSMLFSVAALFVIYLSLSTLRDGYLLIREMIGEISAIKG
jgi:hypothetical protein